MRWSLKNRIALFFIAIPLVAFLLIGGVTFCHLRMMGRRLAEFNFWQERQELQSLIVRSLEQYLAGGVTRARQTLAAAIASHGGMPPNELLQQLRRDFPGLETIFVWQCTPGNSRLYLDRLGREPETRSLGRDADDTFAALGGENGLVRRKYAGEEFSLLCVPLKKEQLVAGAAFRTEGLEQALAAARQAAGTQLGEYEAELYAAVAAEELLLIAAGAGVAVVLGCWSYFMAGSLLRPLRKLERLATAWGNEPLSGPELADNGDEFGELTAAFEQLRRRLTDFLNRLQQEVTKHEALRYELTLGREIQQAMLPTAPLQLPAFQFETLLKPARETCGDFYYYRQFDEARCLLAIGDVSGKGFPAAVFMARLRTLLNHEVLDHQSPGAVLTALNNELARRNESCMFATMQCIWLDAAAGKMVIANGGHLPPVLRRDRECRQLTLRRNILIGVFEREETDFPDESFALEAGDELLFYTDGVTEAFDERRQLFGEERLLTILPAAPSGPAALCYTVLHEVMKYAGNVPQSDDITMLAFRFCPETR